MASGRKRFWNTTPSLSPACRAAFTISSASDGGRRYRLLGEDVLARRERPQCYWQVRGVGRGDGDCVHLGVPQQVVECRIGSSGQLCRLLIGGFGVHVVDGDERALVDAAISLTCLRPITPDGPTTPSPTSPISCPCNGTCFDLESRALSKCPASYSGERAQFGERLLLKVGRAPGTVLRSTA